MSHGCHECGSPNGCECKPVLMETGYLRRPAAPTAIVAESPLMPAQQRFRADLRAVLEELERGLIEKNDAYGDSALNPVRCFARDLDLEAQIRVRMDDKLSRLMRGEIKPGTDIAAEDVIHDLLGYLVLYRIAQRRRHDQPELRKGK